MGVPPSLAAASGSAAPVPPEISAVEVAEKALLQSITDLIMYVP
jgi:hypothetical protein